MLDCQEKIRSLMESVLPILKLYNTPDPKIENWRRPSGGIVFECEDIRIEFSAITGSGDNCSMTFSIYSEQCVDCANKNKDIFDKCFMANIYKGK